MQAACMQGSILCVLYCKFVELPNQFLQLSVFIIMGIVLEAHSSCFNAQQRVLVSSSQAIIVVLVLVQGFFILLLLLEIRGLASQIAPRVAFIMIHLSWIVLIVLSSLFWLAVGLVMLRGLFLKEKVIII